MDVLVGETAAEFGMQDGVRRGENEEMII